MKGKFIKKLAGNIIAFMDNLMNNIFYRGRYDELSAHVATGLNVNKAFSDYPAEDLVNCDTFLAIDQILIKWIVDRLLAEDMRAALDGLKIPQVCEKRSKMHLGENIYTNEYLETLLPKWNAAIQEPDASMARPLQRDFYARNLKNAKERTVVIISEAIRYEVGKDLFRRMQDAPKCTAKLEVQLSVLPFYTRLGIAALLPHTELTMTDDFKVLIDGIPCDNLAEREIVLQKYSPDSVCVQFDSIKSFKVDELRSIFTGKQVVYVYHNQIDARGDNPNTEDEVFVACEEAISEIIDLIRHISTIPNRVLRCTKTV